MQKTHMPETDHVWFDTICAQLEDDEPLPSVSGSLPVSEDDEERTTALDEFILAGLVSPY